MSLEFLVLQIGANIRDVFDKREHWPRLTIQLLPRPRLGLETLPELKDEPQFVRAEAEEEASLLGQPDGGLRGLVEAPVRRNVKEVRSIVGHRDLKETRFSLQPHHAPAASATGTSSRGRNA